MTDLKESRSRKIIMIVDDTVGHRDFLVGLIEQHGYSVLSASSGMACLSLVTRVVPRVILLDVHMPMMDGFETCRRLRANATLGAVPIVFLTASKTNDDVRAGIAAGGNDFMAKPCDPAKLLARIDYWIQKRVGA